MFCMNGIEKIIEILGCLSLEELLEMYRHAEANTIAEENLMRLLVTVELEKRIEQKNKGSR